MQGIDLFRQQNGRMPDVILLQSLFWDVATLYLEDNAGEKQDAVVLAANTLPKAFL